jgi:hypothetical protein
VAWVCKRRHRTSVNYDVDYVSRRTYSHLQIWMDDAAARRDSVSTKTTCFGGVFGLDDADIAQLGAKSVISTQSLASNPTFDR